MKKNVRNNIPLDNLLNCIITLFVELKIKHHKFAIRKHSPIIYFSLAQNFCVFGNMAPRQVCRNCRVF